MSLSINWSLLDTQLAEALESFLNARLGDLDSPYIRNVQVSGFKWGDAAPEVTLLDLTDPYEDFYWQDDGPAAAAAGSVAPTPAVSAATSPTHLHHPATGTASGTATPRSTSPYASDPNVGNGTGGNGPLPRSPTDVQIHVHVAYKGSIELELQLDLGAPLPGGGGGSLWLPMNVRLRGIHLDALFAFAWVNGDRLSWCLLETEDESGSTNIIKALHIETSVGDATRQRLHNVSKVERFLVDQIHRLLDAECVWPNYHTVLLQR
ncbi:Mitochondrial distribution and morphology protein 12 [Blastocladiella emersonii ATCC 22665]|nr:Mitochondrial distribution and morphology protein 12 [Blastocladiella emersonii ATCC 22665]